MTKEKSIRYKKILYKFFLLNTLIKQIIALRLI